MKTKHLIDAYAVARLLELTPRKVQTLVRNRTIPHLTLPTGEIRFDPDDLAAWAETLKQSPELQEVPQ